MGTGQEARATAVETICKLPRSHQESRFAVHETLQIQETLEVVSSILNALLLQGPMVDQNSPADLHHLAPSHDPTPSENLALPISSSAEASLQLTIGYELAHWFQEVKCFGSI